MIEFSFSAVTSGGLRLKPALAWLLLSLAAGLAGMASPAYAQIELAVASPPDGAQVDAPPEIHLCFSQSVAFRDRTKFEFTYLGPDDGRLGMRIAFESSGECVDITPILPDDYSAGEYTLQWKVTAAASDEQGSGTLRFEVTSGGTPAPAPDETPPRETPSAGGGQGGANAGDDDGPDILLLALITAGGVGGGAVLLTLGYLLRRRIGYDLHLPPDGSESGEGH